MDFDRSKCVCFRKLPIHGLFPDKTSSECIIRISNAANSSIFDLSDNFEIILPELTITPQIIAESEQLEEITFNTTVTSTAAIDSVILHYDVTGRRIFDNDVIMEPTGSDNYQVKLDQSKFSALGLEYYITARDTENKKNRAPAEGFYSIKSNCSRRIGNVVSNSRGLCRNRLSDGLDPPSN